MNSSYVLFMLLSYMSFPVFGMEIVLIPIDSNQIEIVTDKIIINDEGIIQSKSIRTKGFNGLSIKLTVEAGKLNRTLTEKYIGKRVKIIINEVVISIPQIIEPSGVEFVVMVSNQLIELEKLTK